jgi:hypothetical protein
LDVGKELLGSLDFEYHEPVVERVLHDEQYVSGLESELLSSFRRDHDLAAFTDRSCSVKAMQ